jgi:8-oxo-dGTP diphosphatase
MSIGRFYGGVGALIRSSSDGKYLLLKRSSEKDFGSGVWECVTGRVDQGEGFEGAVHREVWEELGVKVRVEFIIGTTHFYRGTPVPENELIGIVFGCTLDEPQAISISVEHSEHRWVSVQEAATLLVDTDPSTQWILRVIERAEALRSLSPPELMDYNAKAGFELG